MSIERSSNCKRYTDSVSTIVDAKVSSRTDRRDECKYNTVVYSCQKDAFETPDEATSDMIMKNAKADLSTKGCDVSSLSTSFHTNLVGSMATEYTAENLIKLGLASNCHASGNDPNQATHQVYANCNPMYDMMDAKGNKVRNYNMVFSSDIASCDVSEEAMPQLMEDVRKIAAHNAKTSGYTLEKPEHLACQISVFPHV